MAMPNMKLIGEFVTQLEMPQAFWAFLYKMATRVHFVFPNDDGGATKNIISPKFSNFGDIINDLYLLFLRIMNLA